MLKALIRTRMAALLYSLGRGLRGKKSRSPLAKIGIAALFLYVGVCFIFMFYVLWAQLCEPFHEMGMGWLYFALVGCIAIVICFIGSVMMTKAQLFDAKDNELLLSMPVPPAAILASRMVMLLILNLIMEALVVGPALAVWCGLFAPGAGQIAIFVIAFLALSLVPLALSCIFGWGIAAISSRVRSKNAVSLILSIGFLAAYFIVYSRIGEYITGLISNGAAIADAMRSALPPLYFLGNSIESGSLGQLALFALCAAIPFALVYLLLSKSFIGIATRRTGGVHKKYEAKELRVSSVKSALIRKELARLTSSSMYMMNAGIGLLFLLAGAVLLLINKNMVLGLFAQMQLPSGLSAALLSCAACFVIGMTTFSAPSVSLEGKSIWLMQTMPLEPYEVLRAKAMMHVYVTLPLTLLASLAISIACAPDIATVVLVFLLPALLTLVMAFLGVAVNLRFPKLGWTNEIEAVKQGISVLIAMFAGMALAGLPIIGYIALPSIPAAAQMAIWCAIYAAMTLLFDRYLRVRGADKFMELAA